MRRSCVIVVPCYNEASRLDAPGLLGLLGHPEVRVTFVDDGSTDETSAVLEHIREQAPARIDVLRLPRNQGKGEAVRTGLTRALAAGAEVVGYFDADLATPAAELLRMYEMLDASGAQVLLGSRVKLMGRRVERRLVRHYLGRVFATAASLTIALPVYDTQCGAKLFRASETLRAALVDPFHAAWVFDVELIGRLHRGIHGAPGLGEGAFIEVPLHAWTDVPGSKLKAHHAAKAMLDLARIAVELRTRAGR